MNTKNALWMEVHKPFFLNPLILRFTRFDKSRRQELRMTNRAVRHSFPEERRLPFNHD